MQSAVRQLVFVNLPAHLAALYDGWSPILCIRTGPVGAGSQWSGSWSFHLPKQSLFLLSFLCSLVSNSSVRLPPSPPLTAWLQAQHVFSSPRPLCHTSFCLFHFHFQHSARTDLLRVSDNICADVPDEPISSQWAEKQLIKPESAHHILIVHEWVEWCSAYTALTFFVCTDNVHYTQTRSFHSQTGLCYRVRKGPQPC